MEVALLLLALGAVTFFIGVIVANIAVVQMAKRLNSEGTGRMIFHWWDSVGHSASLVLALYRNGHSREDDLEKRLRIGYWMTGFGLVLMLGISLLHSAKRGSF